MVSNNLAKNPVNQTVFVGGGVSLVACNFKTGDATAKFQNWSSRLAPSNAETAAKGVVKLKTRADTFVPVKSLAKNPVNQTVFVGGGVSLVARNIKTRNATAKFQ